MNTKNKLLPVPYVVQEIKTLEHKTL